MTLNLRPVFQGAQGVVLYRGGQPKSADDWRELARLGVERVVKLNLASEAADSGAVLFQLDVVERPLPPMPSFPPSEAYLQSIDRELPRSLSAGPVTFVHCTEGLDRTGLLVARWRVRVCGWTNAAAHDEWVRCGSHRYKALEDAWKAFAGGAAS